MTPAHDAFRPHAYVDGELTPDEVTDFERRLEKDPAATADVAALRAQAAALHARYDDWLTAPVERFAGIPRSRPWHAAFASRRWTPLAMAASLVVVAGLGLAIGWSARGHADGAARDVALQAPPANAAQAAADQRLTDFVQMASLSHAVFVPEVRHPVEVGSDDEAHLVLWLSKRLGAPLVVPHLGNAGWKLLGGRLLPAGSGPIAQFMYEDDRHRRLTLAVSHGAAVGTRPVPAAAGTASPTASFRFVEENGATVFYWIEDDFAYALTGQLGRPEMTALAGRVYRSLDR